MQTHKLQTLLTYEEGAVEYAKKFNKLSRADEIRMVFSNYPKANPRVIEVGCGNGRDAAEILKFTDDYLGFDLSPMMVKLAKKQLPKGKFVVADLEDFNYPVNTDIIFAFVSLLHSEREVLDNFFQQSYNAMVQSGLMYISLKLGVYKQFIKNDDFGKRTFYLYQPKDIIELTKKQFKVVHQNQDSKFDVKWFQMLLKKI